MIRIASSPDAATFILRMPWTGETEIYNLRLLGHSLSDNSIVVLPFGLKDFYVYRTREADLPSELPLYHPPQPLPTATPRVKYDEAITHYIDRLKGMQASGVEGKVVGARVISAPPKAYRSTIYNSLKKLYPAAFVFYLSTPEVGTWIGASPELLLRREGNVVKSVALAGTRPVGTQGEWDEKNIREQRMVRDFICDVFSRHGLTPEYGENSTQSAGPVEHIMTEISAVCPDRFGYEETAALIAELSPTPALCGLPRKEAMEMLKLKEPFPRHLYGGCIGRIKSNTDWCFFVNLRSALLTSRATFIYVGGGITALSDAVKEWEETELKSVTMLKVFAPNEIPLPNGESTPIKIGSKRHRRRRRRFF